jgi:hypothetical protein
VALLVDLLSKPSSTSKLPPLLLDLFSEHLQASSIEASSQDKIRLALDFCGEVNLLKGRALPTAYNFPGPRPSSVDEHKPLPVYDNGRRSDLVRAFLTIGKALSSVPASRSERSTVLWVTSQFDETPLEQGTFVRTVKESNGSLRLVVDGIRPLMEVNQCTELAAQGETAVHDFVKGEGVKFVSDVCEFVVSTVDMSLTMNLATLYRTKGGDAEKVKQDLAAVTAQLEVCSRSIGLGLLPEDCI